MKTTPSTPLRQFLLQHAGAGQSLSPTRYLVAGTACLGAEDLAGLHRLLQQIRAKAAAITSSARLRRRLELLARFFEESPVAGAGEAERESAFVLYYFLKGYDLIPDSVPEIGLVDDALLVETVLQRHQAALRSHWAARSRTWPENA